MRFQTRLKATHRLIDLTPLVDVVFLMLIFFIVASDILPFKSLNIENPKLPIDSTPMTTQLLIVMDAQNVIFVGSKKVIVDLSSLKEHLENELEEMKYPRFASFRKKSISPTLVLSVDRRVEYGAFLELFSIVQSTGYPIRLVYQGEENEPS